MRELPCPCLPAKFMTPPFFTRLACPRPQLNSSLPRQGSPLALPLVLAVIAAIAPAQAGAVAFAADMPYPARAAPEAQAAGPVRRVAIDGLTLRNAVGIAISRHPDISRANAVVAQSTSEVEVARAAWYPKIEYGVLPGYGGGFGSGGNSSGARATLAVKQLLYDFGRTASRVSAADATLNKQQYLLADTVETVAYNTAASFIELAASQDVIAAAKRQVAALGEIRVKIVDRVKAGLSVSSDRNLADVAILRAQAEVLKANTRFDVAASKLAELIGTRPQRVSNLGASAEYVRRLGDTGLDTEGTPSVLAAGAARDAAEARLRLAEAERFPSIGIGFSRSVSTGRANANDDTWVGLSLTGDFSLGNLAQHRIAAAEADRRAASDALENQRLVTRTALNAAATEAAGAAARLSSYEQIIGLSHASRDLYWQEYMLNKRSLTEVFNPEREIFLAEVEWTNAIADGLLAQIKTYVAVGKLVELLREHGGQRDE